MPPLRASPSSWASRCCARSGRTAREQVNAVEGAGCEECAHTGYRGRSGIYEFLPVTDAIKELILERASAG